MLIKKVDLRNLCSCQHLCYIQCQNNQELLSYYPVTQGER